MMRCEKKMSELAVGECAVVTALETPDTLRRRLHDLGLIRGTRVRCLLISPLGNPAAYLIRGAVIALRNADAATVLVQTPCP